ncbi:hypothetical protein Btru_053288 [Bulinus truncatus]|nr:hypothetical protein Btru_053288 [Bulinus truncatus]
MRILWSVSRANKCGFYGLCQGQTNADLMMCVRGRQMRILWSVSGANKCGSYGLCQGQTNEDLMVLFDSAAIGRTRRDKPENFSTFLNVIFNPVNQRPVSDITHFQFWEPQTWPYHFNDLLVPGSFKRKQIIICREVESRAINFDYVQNQVSRVVTREALKMSQLCVNVLLETDPASTPRQTFIVVWLKAIPLVLLAFLTVTFNVMVLWMFKVKKSLRSCKNIYLASLAMADLIIGGCMFVAAVEQVKGRVEWLSFVSCRMYLVVRQSALYISLLSLLLITGDRWWSIHYPFSYRTRRRKRNAFMAVGFVWVIGFALQIIPVAVWDVINKQVPTAHNISDGHYEAVVLAFPSCELPFLYSISFVAAVSAVQYFIPLVSMLTLNCSLYVGILSRKKIQIRRSLNSSDKLYSYDKRNSVSSVQDYSSSAEEYAQLLNGVGHKAMTTGRYNAARRYSAGPILLRASQSAPPFTNVPMMCTARRFSWAPRKCSLRPSKDGEELAKSLLVKQDRRAACWLGLLVIIFLLCWLPHTIVGIMLTLRHHGVPAWARDVTFWFLLANSAINPLLYGFFNKEIREAFKQWMFGSSRRQLRVKNAVFVYGMSLPVNARRISSFDTVPE